MVSGARARTAALPPNAASPSWASMPSGGAVSANETVASPSDSPLTTSRFTRASTVAWGWAKVPSSVAFSDAFPFGFAAGRTSTDASSAGMSNSGTSTTSDTGARSGGGQVAGRSKRAVNPAWLDLPSMVPRSRRPSWRASSFTSSPSSFWKRPPLMVRVACPRGRAVVPATSASRSTVPASFSDGGSSACGSLLTSRWAMFTLAARLRARLQRDGDPLVARRQRQALDGEGLAEAQAGGRSSCQRASG